MNSQDNSQQDLSLDALLARSPVRAADTFADQTIARLAAYEAGEEARLDDLLSRHTVKTGDAFTEKTLARLAGEPADDKLDELLAAKVVEAGPEFTPQTLERVRREAGPSHRQRWLASVAGLAAAVGIAFVSLVPPSQTADLSRHGQPTVSEATTQEALALANGLSGADGLLDGETVELLALLSDQPGI